MSDTPAKRATHRLNQRRQIAVRLRRQYLLRHLRRRHPRHPVKVANPVRNQSVVPAPCIMGISVIPRLRNIGLAGMTSGQKKRSQ